MPEDCQRVSGFLATQTTIFGEAMQDLLVPISVWVLTCIGLGLGWVLHVAVERFAYKISGMRRLDSYVLSFLFGLLGAFTPMLLYLAFGFDEFSSTPEGTHLKHRLRFVARLGVSYLILFAALVLIAVPQKRRLSHVPRVIWQISP
ncbi:MAG: hypothetical protein ACLPJY_08565 [Rhodomicrobium sp.]